VIVTPQPTWTEAKQADRTRDDPVVLQSVKRQFKLLKETALSISGVVLARLRRASTTPEIKMRIAVMGTWIARLRNLWMKIMTTNLSHCF
jgi:hypothetical protein